MVNANTGKAHRVEMRRRYFVDPQVQGALIRQAIWYWLWTSITFGLVIILCRVAPSWLSGKDHPSGQLWYHLGPYVLASAVLFPVVVFSAIRCSHRFVGPMVRVRRTLKELAAGESVDELRLREHDYWTDIADHINEIAARLSRHGHDPANQTGHDQQAIVTDADQRSENHSEIVRSRSLV